MTTTTACRRLTSALQRAFRTVTLTLLSLLLPLSLLLLARLSAGPQDALHFLRIPPISACLPTIILSFALLVLHLLSPLVSLLSLAHVSFSSPTCGLPTAGVSLSWAVICIYQLAVALGVQATVHALAILPPYDQPPSDFNAARRVVFSLGVYETTVVFSRTFVRVVVDDTIYGPAADAPTEESSRMEAAALGLAFAVLWLRLVKEEVEGLLLVSGAGGDGMAGIWIVYQLIGVFTQVTGLVRALRLGAWVGRTVGSRFRLQNHVIQSRSSPEYASNDNNDKIVKNSHCLDIVAEV